LAKAIKPIRGSIGITAVLAFVAAAFLVIQAVSLSQAIAFAFLRGDSFASLRGLLVLGLGAWIARTTAVSVSDWWSRRAGLQSVADTRRLAIGRLARVPLSQMPLTPGASVALLTRGIEGLEIYVARYLPQLVISAIVPLGLGAVILWLDPLAALIIVVTIPLIPLFMALVGWFTQSNVEKHWQQVMSLSSTLTDLMNGLPELKIFGRAKAQAAEIERLGGAQQDATMKVLRLSFLSAFVLELLATISVALIAVAIGLRLVNGEMELWRGLAALVLAPEVYAPLRMLGVHFHAAADGLEAWSQVSRILDASERQPGDRDFPVDDVSLEWTDMTVQLGERTVVIPAGRAAAGAVTAIVGPSGCGKSTLLNVAIANLVPATGSFHFGGVAPDEISQVALARNVAFVAQSPWLGEGTVFEVVTRGLDGVSRESVAASLAQLNIDVTLETHISDRSEGVSVGQRRRLAIVRAMVSGARVVVMDEPSAALDEASEASVMDALRELAARGATVLVVAHRQAMRDSADAVIDFGSVMN
jgi:ATP-binding cassette subfamily C protein CydCD